MHHTFKIKIKHAPQKSLKSVKFTVKWQLWVLELYYQKKHFLPLKIEMFKFYRLNLNLLLKKFNLIN